MVLPQSQKLLRRLRCCPGSPTWQSLYVARLSQLRPERRASRRSFSICNGERVCNRDAATRRGGLASAISSAWVQSASWATAALLKRHPTQDATTASHFVSLAAHGHPCIEKSICRCAAIPRRPPGHSAVARTHSCAMRATAPCEVVFVSSNFLSWVAQVDCVMGFGQESLRTAYVYFVTARDFSLSSATPNIGTLNRRHVPFTAYSFYSCHAPLADPNFLH